MSVRTPVESISMRLMIGCVKMLLQPGTCKTRAHFVIHKIAFGARLAGPEKDLIGKCPVEIRPQRVERLKSGLVNVLSNLRFNDFLRKSFRFGPQPDILGLPRLAARFD